MPTIKDLFENKYLDLTYPDLLKVCQEIDNQDNDGIDHSS